MKINVYAEKSGNFAEDSKKKPMIIIESKKKPLEPGKKDKNGKPILSLKDTHVIRCAAPWNYFRGQICFRITCGRSVGPRILLAVR